MQREGGGFSSWLVLALAATLLTVESLLPGNVFLPLTPDDFPAWSAGRRPEDLRAHPHPNWCMSDVLHLFVPGLATTRGALDARTLPPGWDPTQALGVPHVDEVHYAVFYPPAWAPLLLGMPGLAVMAWLHLLVAGGGMLLYLQALRRTPAAALAGALAFALSGWMTARLHAFPVVGAAVWLPWILWGLERGAQTGRRLPYAVAALSLTLSILAGFPQVTLLVAGLAALLEVVRLGASLKGRQPAVRSAVSAVVVFVLAGVMAAPQLLPTQEYLQEHSARSEQEPAVVAQDGLEWPLLTHLLAPDYYATAALPGPHPLAMQAMERARTAPVSVNRAETSMGVGVMGLLLALVALCFGRRWTTRTFAVVVVGCMALLLWPAALEAAAGLLPPLRVGSPKRLLLLTSFGLSVLAAGGLDLLRQQRLRYVVLCWILSLTVTAGAVLLMIRVPSTAEDVDVNRWAEGLPAAAGLDAMPLDAVYSLIPMTSFRTAAQAAFNSASVALAAALAAILLFRPRSAPSERGWVMRMESMPGVIPFLIGLELLVTAWPMLRAAPVEGVTSEPARIDRLRVPAVASAARGTDPEAVVPPRVLRVGNDPSYLRPNFPGLFGLHDVQAYAPMLPQRVVELLEAVAPGMHLSGSILGGVPDGSRLARPAWDMLGVEAVLTDDPALLPPGFELQESVGHVRVLRNTEALERAFFVDRFLVVPDDALRVERIAEPEFEPRYTAVLAAPPRGLADAQVFQDRGGPDGGVVVPRLGPDGPRPRNVSVNQYAPGAIRVALGPGAPGMLVVSETWHPGWTATAGGAALPVQAANHALLGVTVASAEKQVIELSYEPETARTGLAVGGAGLGALALWCLLPLVFGRGGRRPAVR